MIPFHQKDGLNLEEEKAMSFPGLEPEPDAISDEELGTKL